MTKPQILVIRHGALGDIILSTAAFAAIRTHHPDAYITLLTTKPFANLLKQSPYFDEVTIDARQKWWKLKQWLNIYHFLRSKPWECIYDLQTSTRSTLYFKFLPSPKPLFSGIAKGCSYEHNTPQRISSHTLDRQREQLNIAGIMEIPAPNTTWMQGDGAKFHLPAPYALIAAGGSAHRPEKRWTVDGFAALGTWLISQGITPVLLGTAAESDVLNAITTKVTPQGDIGLINLCNQTSFGDVAQIARAATLAVGNDTGPMHIIAASGCPSIVLFSHASNPDLCAPRGNHITILRMPDLKDLKAEDVIAAAKANQR